MSDTQWRFPDNRYTNENGLNTGDMETFKKDPVSSLAREICQNSIDAAYGQKPVRVEFHLFSTERKNIPGIDELESQITACYKYKKDSPKEGLELGELLKAVSKPVITCLRISDFNTTGIFGANTNEKDTPFYNLTKGSGVSNKDGTSGGSKGIGKFASFVASDTNTVFYSTRAKDGCCAYIGISKLRSAPIPGADPDLLTMGIGYYGIGEKNLPVLEELMLDNDFSRKENEFGTDVFIIGFNGQEGWKNDIIAKILDSFMVAVFLGELEVVVDDLTVNKDSIKEIIYSDSFQSERTPTEVKGIRAQYELLQEDDTVTKTELHINNNAVTVYLKQYNQLNEANATKHCVMVRYPYMKITYIRPGAFLPFSALCIIHNNELNVRLRDIENPQHTDWEIKRLNKFPEEKRITKALKKQLEDKVTDYIRTVLKDSSGESTDIEGAGEYLPSQDDFGMSVGNTTINDRFLLNPVSKVITQTPKTVKTGETGESYEFAYGELSENGEFGKKPKKKNGKPDPNPAPKSEPTGDDKVGPGNSGILRKVPLSGMRYRNVVIDKAKGKYICFFTSLFDEEDCEFSVRMCGESADKYPVDIYSATINGDECTINDGKITGSSIAKGQVYTIVYSVNSDELFASEVILNAYR